MTNTEQKRYYEVLENGSHCIYDRKNNVCVDKTESHALENETFEDRQARLMEQYKKMARLNGASPQ